MRYLSVCSGIEAATCAWHHMGWKPEAFSEIEPFPSAVLAHHYPDTPNLGDMTKYKEWNLGAIDLLVGGTPCQSFSVAGLRKGLADPRGNLALVYLGIADLFKPKWIVWENVPGVLSSNGGRDFGSFLGALAQLGYGFAYRVLDAQWFGVAQRRKRVFVVGHLGDWRPAAAVLFESESLSGNPKPSREKGEETSRCLTRGSAQRYDAESETMIPVGVSEVMATLLSSTAGVSRTGNAVTEHETYIPMSAIPLNSMTMQGRPSDDGRMGSGIGQPGDPCPTITKAHSHAVAQPISIQGNLIGREAGGPKGVGASDEGVMYTLTKADVHGVAQPMAVHENQRSELTLNETVGTVTCSGGKPGQGYPAVIQPISSVAYGFEPGIAKREGNSSRFGEEISPTLRAAMGDNQAAVAVGVDTYNGTVQGNIAATLTADMAGPTHSGPKVMQSMAVRRLTPRECERLQGFRDDYTLIPWRGKEAPDGPRYKALGNSMAVPVMRWIGERIESLRLLQR